MRSTIDRQTLMLLLHYEPSTGKLTWNIGRRKCNAYAEAGTLDSHGYRQVMVEGRQYAGHRLIWFWMTGRWPRHEVDHKNRVRDDNRWVNLREATTGEQRQNQKERSDASSGFRGVGYLEAKNKWLARIALQGRRRHLGLHDTIIDAVAARLGAERQLFTHAPQ